VRLGQGFDGTQYSYITRDSKDSEWRTIAEWGVGQSKYRVLGFATNPQSVLVRARHEGRHAVFEMNLTGTQEQKLLFAHPEVDVAGSLHWPSDGRLIGFTYVTDRVQRHFTDPVAKVVHEAIDQLLPGADNFVADATPEGQKLLVVSRSDVIPDRYFVLDTAARKLEMVGTANDALAGSALAEMKPVTITTPSGPALPAYLTVPVGSTGKQLPLVVFPHGGPHSRDQWGYNGMVQFMVSRGYAVLQVNFRGSAGYGSEWHAAGLRNWGTVMVDDISAATRWAISEGIADAKRVCIVGWSYGGYAALMSAAKESELYRCAASIAGITDLRALLAEQARFVGGDLDVRFQLGDDASELKAGSPRHAASQIRIPVLLVHGEHDWQAHVEHTRRMSKALQAVHRKHHLLLIPGGNHMLSRFEWRERLLTELERFLSKNL
jgi:dipeptidyl aminopeptidase/acylaminoacyl peptidase